MSTQHDHDPELEERMASRLMDVLIRAGLILALVMLCFQVFSPFLNLMIWALILAVTLYPMQVWLAARLGGRQGLAATLLVLLGVVVVVVPTAALMSSLGDSVQGLINDVQNNTLVVPPPREGVANWPLVGDKVHAFWTRAHTDLPALVQSMQPKIGNLAKAALGFVAGIGGGLLQFLGSLDRRRHHDGLRRVRRARCPVDLPEDHRRSARGGVRRPVDRDHPRGRQGRARRRLHPGDHRRPLPARRGRAVGGRARGHRARARHRPGAGRARHAAGDRLALVEQRLRNRRRTSSTPCCCWSRAWPTTC